MTALRRLLLTHRALTATLIALALLMKLLVPTGFMPVASGGGITVEICTGFGAQKMVMAIPGTAHRGGKADHQKADMPCAFAGLATPALAAIDPLLLAVAILFVMAMVFRVPVAPVVRGAARLRPPLRGPPARG
ncbi:hypothetical protein PQ455_12345 [Sphingomonas naphthae]|uniref:DUF2946 domain-containing protein n=1 Tax=Sphingomonas naphthae TaxID=1813468 RepID=A0ABY7THH1_9SPHN|nr:DUF2946 family protein [Sphingomonas naphthae]WCT72426.1 hypothetical protein PQ455_12345 [Sphingomonas naphthae]